MVEHKPCCALPDIDKFTDRPDVTTVPKRLADRLTYANIVATIALFVGLGGASYAAITLPAGSVGAKQLRANAVGLGDLSFPLGAAGIDDSKVEDLTKGVCNSPLRLAGNAVPPCFRSLPGGPTPGREVHVLFRSPGRLLISAVVSLKNEGAPQTTAHITLGLNVDRKRVTASEITSAGGQATQVPVQALVDVPAGVYTAGLAVSAQYDSNGPGDVLVSSASLIASAFPADPASRK